MRLLSFVLLACIVFLSGFGGLVKPAVAEKADCCKNEKACHKVPPGQTKEKGNCKEPVCNLMFSCQLCGFIVKEAVKLNAIPPCSLPTPVTPYIAHHLGDYQPDNWKPPQLAATSVNLNLCV